MKLTIHKMATRCHASRQGGDRQGMVNRVARERFPDLCAKRLSARLSALPGVVRIRRLPIRLKLPSARFDEEALANAWADAFVHSLFGALAQPTGAGAVELVRADSRAAWIARFITDLLLGVAHLRWEYEEYRELFRLKTSEAIVAALLNQPAELIATLLELQHHGRLDRTIARIDDLAMERLYVAIAAERGTMRPAVTLDHVLQVGRLVRRQPASQIGRGWASRQRGLGLFIELIGEQGLAATGAWSPRLVLYALMCMETLAAMALPRDPRLWGDRLRPEAIARHTSHPAVLQWLEEVRDLARRSYRHDTAAESTRANPLVEVSELISASSFTGSTGGSGSLAELADLMAELQPMVSPASATKDEGWVSSDCAGLMLLVGLLSRFGWAEQFYDSPCGAAYGHRAITYCMAGLGLAILDRFHAAPAYLDPGLAMFAGWLKPEAVDMAGFRHFLAAGSPAERRQMLVDLTGETAELDRACASWAATFDALAERLIREFAVRVRGFRQASRAFVARHFLALHGRINVRDDKVTVILAPHTFHVALHSSSLDEAVAAVTWLGGRRVEFHLEGL
jgi:hypothetical protein